MNLKSLTRSSQCSDWQVQGHASQCCTCSWLDAAASSLIWLAAECHLSEERKSQTLNKERRRRPKGKPSLLHVSRCHFSSFSSLWCSSVSDQFGLNLLFDDIKWAETGWLTAKPYSWLVEHMYGCDLVTMAPHHYHWSKMAAFICAIVASFLDSDRWWNVSSIFISSLRVEWFEINLPTYFSNHFSSTSSPFLLLRRLQCFLSSAFRGFDQVSSSLLRRHFYNLPLKTQILSQLKSHGDSVDWWRTLFGLVTDLTSLRLWSVTQGSKGHFAVSGESVWFFSLWTQPAVSSHSSCSSEAVPSQTDPPQNCKRRQA